MVQRKEYLARLAAWWEKHVIKVVSGVRRCGKSTLLLQYIDWLKASGVGGDQIISINLEDPEFDSLLNQQVLYGYVKKRLCKNKCGGISYYQAAASVLDPAVLERELSSLKKIKDNHPKYLLSLDDIPARANHDGIIQRYLIDWLLDKSMQDDI